MADDQANDQILPTDLTRWQRECELAAFIASFLLRLTRRSYASSAAIEILRTIPRSIDEMVEGVEQGLFWRLLMEAVERREPDDKDLDLFRGLVEGYMELPKSRRAFIEASVIGSLIGAGTG